MFRISTFLLTVGAVAMLSSVTVQAADTSAPEARMRETLRNTMLQLRTAQTERDTLQAEKAQNEQEKKALSDKFDALVKQSGAEKDAADKSIAELKAKTTEQQAEIARLNEALEKWKTGYKQAADLAGKKENDRAKLAAEVIDLQRKVADQQTKNAAMYKLGNEILTRYEKFGLGTAITAREPFVGITRVKLQNLVQDYQDKLTEQKIKP